MKLFHSALPAAVALTLLAGCGGKPSSQAQTQSTNPADINNPLVNAKRTADKTIGVASLNQAIQLFNVQEGHYPQTLDELTPKYVAKIPDAPLGYKFNYDPAQGVVTIKRK
ncbi:MAG TPA: hypothetical protein VL970_07405 [Candidatus Acidoferrales bacterium]|nr:hypothetical protein [Candidatus Acidoferrales bacterium]